MIPITLSEKITGACPDLHLLVLSCSVINKQSDEQLWSLIEEEATRIKSITRLENINELETIRSTRQAYKRLGKDPNRYRPSAEALRRRILRDLPLYKVDTLVDVINLVSIRSGYSIGGFDADQISGNLTLGVGRAEDKYEAIGRGKMNIEGLPVYRDAIGGIGTPTSDEERTKIHIHTTNLLMIINGYSGLKGLTDAAFFTIDLLTKYVSATQVKGWIINHHEQKAFFP